MTFHSMPLSSSKNAASASLTCSSRTSPHRPGPPWCGGPGRRPGRRRRRRRWRRRGRRPRAPFGRCSGWSRQTPTRLPGTPVPTLRLGAVPRGYARRREGTRPRGPLSDRPDGDRRAHRRPAADRAQPARSIVVDEHDHPIAVLPGSQVLRAMIPPYVQDDPALARVLDEEFADTICDKLAEHTVRELCPRTGLRCPSPTTTTRSSSSPR